MKIISTFTHNGTTFAQDSDGNYYILTNVKSTPLVSKKDFDTTTHENVEQEIMHILHSLGMPAHIKGYNYLKTAIKLAIEEPNSLESVTKILYPTVANHYGVTPGKVERGIRNAIKTSWLRADLSTLESIFGCTVNSVKGKATNSEFIAMIAEKVKSKII